MKRQIRVSVNGAFQFNVTTHDPDSEVAVRAADVMRLRNMRAVHSPGQINFVPGAG